MREYTLPGEQPNIKSFYETYGKIEPLEKTWSQEPIGYYDCFYRNIYKYKYIGVFDIDELIVPTNADNWTQIIDNLKVGFKGFNLIKLIILLIDRKHLVLIGTKYRNIDSKGQGSLAIDIRFNIWFITWIVAIISRYVMTSHREVRLVVHNYCQTIFRP